MNTTVLPPPADPASQRDREFDAWPWQNGIAELGDSLSVEVRPAPLPNPVLLHRNQALLAEIGGAEIADASLCALTAGAAAPDGAIWRASVYAGHQFGVWVPQLGDGRAILIGELGTGNGPLELQIKGAGPTPFSRFADGRAVLRSTIREYLCSEAMHGLRIATTRALSLIVSSETVQRETREPAAALIRTAPSHLRFGHFEYFSHSGQTQRLRELADYVIRRHAPEAVREDGSPDYARWATRVIGDTAEMIAAWQCVGFCHGVMNTDNMSILGLTIDYGPYGFLDRFDAGHVCNHSDHGGRYAWDQQPRVAHWNLARFLQAILPLLSQDEDESVAVATDLLARFHPDYTQKVLARWRAKLGLSGESAADAVLIETLLGQLQRYRLDFSASFRLITASSSRDACPEAWSAFDGLQQWWGNYRQRLASESMDAATREKGMRAANPRYVLRNHLAQQAIDAAEHGDYGEIARLMHVLARPSEDHPGYEDLCAPPPADATPICVSCSS